MAMIAAAPTDMSIQLPADVYQEQSEFIALVRDVTNSIDGDTPEETVREQVDLLDTGSAMVVDTIQSAVICDLYEVVVDAGVCCEVASSAEIGSAQPQGS
jgi:hypothetical protein